MSSQKEPEPIQGADSGGYPSERGPAIHGGPQPQPSANADGNGNGGSDGRQPRQRDSAPWFRWDMVKRVIEVLGFFALVFYAWQARNANVLTRKAIDGTSPSFQESLKELKRQSKAKTMAANAAKSAADTASATLHDSEISADQTLQQMKPQTIAQRGVAESAAASLEQSLLQGRCDNRPWLTVGNTLLGDDVSEHSATVLIYYNNSGRSPALGATAESAVVLWPPDITPSVIEETLMQAPGPGPAPAEIANGEKSQYFEPAAKSFAEPAIANYRAKKENLYVVGRIRYFDVEGAAHFSKSCIWHQSGSPAGRFEFCPTGNVMDPCSKN